MANVFISHRSQDTQHAEQLAREVRKAGHDVWLDVWKLKPGDSAVDRINQGLESADYVLVCYSASGITSPWMGREWMSALARQLEGYGVKVLPVLLTGGGPPAIMADFIYADLVKDWTVGVQKLLLAMR